MRRASVVTLLVTPVVVVGLGLWLIRLPGRAERTGGEEAAPGSAGFVPGPGHPMAGPPVQFGPGQLLVLRNEAGAAVVEITAQIADGAFYRWRFQPAGGGAEQHGEGKLYERFEGAEKMPDGSIRLHDMGSQLDIQAGPFRIPWSSGGANFGWIYLDRDTLGAEIVNDQRFDEVGL